MEEPGKRVALIIGNGEYKTLQKLKNPKNDAILIEDTLRNQLGFNTVYGGRQNGLDRSAGDMSALLSDFSKAIQGAEIALIYYAGHGGADTLGEQYLLGVEYGNDQRRVSSEGLGLSQIMERLSRGGAKNNLVFLDSCRDPLRGDAIQALTPKKDARNTVILFATSAEDSAADGSRGNSPFARAIAAEMVKPGSEWRDFELAVSGRVRSDTQGRQEPKPYGHLENRFYFIVDPGDKAIEKTFWESIQNSNDPSDFEAYLRKFPNGNYRDLAENRLRRLKPGQPEPVPPKPVPMIPVQPPIPTPVGKVFQDCPDCPEMVVIPAGRFTMGSPANEKDRRSDEGPQHEVSVQSFALGKTEVTVGEFRRFVQATRYKTEAERNVTAQGCYTYEIAGDNFKLDWRAERYWDNPGFLQSDKQPVACISWNDAKEYIKWLSNTTGKPYRLPSEAEWEYAARAGSTTARPWGDNPDEACRYANVADQTTHEGRSFATKHECKDGYWFTAPVANYTANAFGLYDMMGNVWEWVEDCYQDSYRGAPTDGSAQSKNCATPVGRVLRGGSWDNVPQDARPALRLRGGTALRDFSSGLRPARMLP